MNSPVTNDKKFFEEISLYSIQSYGNYQVTEAEIIEFATKYDPFDFHTNPEKAKKSAIGGLIASGIHTLAILQRLTVEHVYSNWHVVAGKHISNCNFVRPVYPQDTLHIVMTVEHKKSGIHRDRGYLQIEFLVKNQNEKLVLITKCEVVIARIPL